MYRANHRAFSTIITASHIKQLKTKGYTIIKNPPAAKICQEAVSLFTETSKFRYPPLEEFARTKELDQVYSAAFNSLYKLAGITLSEISSSFPVPSSSVLPIDTSLTNQPFSAKKLPYNNSFASIFNFNHGFLNKHKDRGLITLVNGFATSPNTNRVSLWCKSHHGNWVDIGVEASINDIVIFSGEQLEEATNGEFKAVDHACRVTPDGERINTRLLTEPEAEGFGNRQSVALVLCEGSEGVS